MEEALIFHQASRHVREACFLYSFVVFVIFGSSAFAAQVLT